MMRRLDNIFEQRFALPLWKGNFPALKASALVVMAGIFCMACSDDIVEHEFFEPRTMYPYEFDGQPEITGPEALYFVGLQVGDSQVKAATIENAGRSTLEIEEVEIEGPFDLMDFNEGAGEKQLLPGEELSLSVHYQAVDDEGRQGLMTIWSDDPEQPRLDVELVASAEYPCPTAVINAESEEGHSVANPQGSLEGKPLETVYFDGTDSHGPDGTAVVDYEWRLVDTPQDTFVVLEEPSDLATNALYLELSGNYVVELDVWDENGERSCEPARMAVNAVSGDAIHLQLVWDTPTDPDPFNQSGTDLDLHFLHEAGSWNRVPFDCHWMNPNPDWGDPGDARMNPRLDIDEINGWGPENINLDIPEAGTRYGVGVNYFSDHGYGPSYATVRIFIHGVLEREFSGQYMVDGEFWHVADIDWPSQDIRGVDEVTFGFPTN